MTVNGLDCLDGTQLLDLKPDRTLFTPIAPPQPGDFQVAAAAPSAGQVPLFSRQQRLEDETALSWLRAQP